MDQHFVDRPEEISYMEPDFLYRYWRKLDEKTKEELGIAVSEIEAEKHFNLYFTEIVENLLSKYKATNKTECYDTYMLVEFWETIPGKVKIKHKMAF